MSGAVGTATGMERLDAWLRRCRSAIDAPAEASLPNLFPSFPGVKSDCGFFVELASGSNLQRIVRKKDIDAIKKIESAGERVKEAVDLYYSEIEFLSQNRSVDVIVCVIPEDLYLAVEATRPPHLEETLEEGAFEREEHNFRRALKARAMHLGRPLQLIRNMSLGQNVAGQQDDASKAWNFCTALYYKSGPTVPWKLERDATDPASCCVGIAFYRSRDYRLLNTSLAQIFDELGHGVILRGAPVDLDKDNRRPHLTAAQAYELLQAALAEYRSALHTLPREWLSTSHPTSVAKSWRDVGRRFGNWGSIP